MRARFQHVEAGRKLARRLGVEDTARRLYWLIAPASRRDWLDNNHLRLLIALCLPQDANCIDVGAHTGLLLREMVRCAPRGRHIAYEPLPEFASRLRTEFPGVEVRNAALSNQAGNATFFHVRDDPMQSGLRLRTGAHPASATAISVRVERLDDALPEGYVPSLIKIDVEGAERQVIEGAIETISRHTPLVCFEHGTVEHGTGAEAEYQTKPVQIYDLLVRQAGMRIFDIDGNGPYSEARFTEVYQEPIWNFVAHR